MADDDNKLVKTHLQAKAKKAIGRKRTEYRVSEARGLYLVVSPTEAKSWVYRYRPRGGGNPRKLTLGRFYEGVRDSNPSLGAPHTLAEARAAARKAAADKAAGTDLAAAKREVLKPTPPPEVPETFEAVAKDFIKRWVDTGGKKKGGVPLRSKGEIERQFNAYVYPEWKDEPFLSIRRRAVIELMDDLEDNRGAVQADRVLATLTTLFNWYASRDEHYTSPIIRGMRRSGNEARKHTFKDDQIRALWDACEGEGTFGALCRVALLTGARRGKLRTMRWADLGAVKVPVEVDGREVETEFAGVWTMATEAREKSNAGSLKLPKQALDIIKAQPVIKGNPYVFAGSGTKAFNSFSKGKRALDEVSGAKEWELEKAEEGDKGWRFHDLRRTARTLLSRAKVQSDISERVLGHTIKGVEGTYDRYDYFTDKADALEALAALVDRILDPPGDNVVPITGVVAG